MDKYGGGANQPNVWQTPSGSVYFQLRFWKCDRYWFFDYKIDMHLKKKFNRLKDVCKTLIDLTISKDLLLIKNSLYTKFEAYHDFLLEWNLWLWFIESTWKMRLLSSSALCVCMSQSDFVSSICHVDLAFGAVDLCSTLVFAFVCDNARLSVLFVMLLSCFHRFLLYHVV